MNETACIDDDVTTINENQPKDELIQELEELLVHTLIMIRAKCAQDKLQRNVIALAFD